MALIKAHVPYEGEDYCLLMDAVADSIEVVHSQGFSWNFDQHLFDFYSSYYEEVEVPDALWQTLMVRRLEGSDLPVGIMVDDVSLRFKPRRRRRVPTTLEVIDSLFYLAYHNLGAKQTERLVEPGPKMPIAPAGLPDFKVNGDRVLS